ncbi:hypothetical protein J3Q64DRAFT_1698978 [Phycomyces blakesleeanus]|uniref:F-box domain-containing protein n=2 Tax=Phycomyces blakesleeanus TaxID=4837 RepID=A0A162PIR6_PHYB8|nr:hypothetical protein PHYBLDRAFT_168599 [Phycomyces blakesleeanus NRRL 1555(-)]OAD73247.1 hypothetical protein PHYBLDRAFT_168599 [Phycomyces blakesleeanus NRRL 1555(-)]|eukprot:XP_018291287.1 hypothetical protein PHYBLDRAFT_168599 [Phycomyces blakesleeanus NRRL 1555(-)]
MGISKLPYEILAQIGDNLSTTDRHSCTLTCKRWRYPFQNALWRNMWIFTYEGMQRLTNNIKNSQNIPATYPFLVHSLHIRLRRYWPEISDEKFSTLFRCFPNLKRLDIEDIVYTDIYTEITRSDNIWKSLKSLRIQYRQTGETDQAQILLELIATCSLLHELEILKKGPSCRIEFDVYDLDRIHQNLQSLSSIKAKIYLSPDLSAALDTIPDTTPAFAVTYLDINSKKFENKSDYLNGNWNEWNPLWLYYFGYKYPNLRSLKLNSTGISGNLIDADERQRIISLLHSNPNAFQHLETFDFTNDKYFELSDFVLWELFYALKVPLKHLTLDATQDGKVDDSYPIDVNTILQSFSETLKSLSVTGFTYNYNDQDTAIELSYYYPLLTDICISGSNVSLNLDNILDKCVALIQLKFGGGKLFINPNTTTKESEQKQQHHGLMVLTLLKFSAAAEVFKNISFRCRSLRHMTLNGLCATGSICEETGRLLFDMSHTFLKTLNISQVQYCTSYEEMNASNAGGLTLLSQLNDSQLSDTKNGREKENMDSECPVVAIHNIDWIYTYWNYGYNYAHILDTRKLSKEEADIALEYYQNFQASKISETLEDFDFYDKKIKYMDDKLELDKGYSELRFGNIETVLISTSNKIITTLSWSGCLNFLGYSNICSCTREQGCLRLVVIHFYFP